ncbi:MAG: Xaa-Pro peptidase family protein [Candidatus Peribacteraceae bacterium]
MRPKGPKTLLRRAGTPLYLVTDPLNIRYLSGVGMSAGALLVTPERYLLFTDARYGERAGREARKGIAIRAIDDLQRYLRKGVVCGFESERVTVGGRARWAARHRGVRFVPRPNVVEHFRRQKEEDEVRALRRAHRLTRELLRRIPRVLRPGVTELQVARQLAVWSLEAGAEGLSFDPIVAFGAHTSSPHHAPTSRALRRGDIVQIDVGAKVEGYCADMSEVFFTAAPTDDQRRVHGVLRSVQKKAMREAAAGVSTHVLDRLVRDRLRTHGLEEAFTHALGHGVGLEIHEGVTLSHKRPEETLLAGEVITVEPGVYFPGRWGMRVEDMVYIS